jgi:hypothetical protein
LREQGQDLQTIQKFYQRFRRAQTAVQSKQMTWTELDMFDRGEQWKNEQIPPWIPKPITNYVRFVRTLKRANLASAIPKPTFTPLIPQYREQVSKLQKAHDHVWETQKVDRDIRECIDRALLQGTSIAYVYNDDYFYGGQYYGENDNRNQLYQGKICVKRYPLVNFFPDPDAYELDDCKWIECTELMPLAKIKTNSVFIDYVKEKYGKNLLDTLNSTELEFESSANGTIFDRDAPPDTSTQNIIGDEMATVHIHWERYTNKEGKVQLDVSYYLRSTDFFLLRIEDMQPNVYPFAVLYDEKEENDFHGTSMIQQILENQKVINKLDQTVSIIGVLHQNPQKIVSRESGINAQELARTGTLPGKVWTTNSDPASSIFNVRPPEIPMGAMQLKDRMVQDIRDISGINEAYTGQSVGSLTTSTGVNSLIERATVRDRDKMIQIDEFVERISQLIVLNILYKWQDVRPITTTSPDGQPNFDMYEPVDQITADNLEWIIKSDVYAKAPVTQASKRQQADALMQMQGQFNYNPPIITPEEWIQFQDFDINEEILYRMEEDRKKLEENQAQDLAGKMAQLVAQATDAISKGASQQEVQQMLQQAAQQLIGKQEAEEMKNGRPRDVAKTAQAPQGTTGQLAMNAMARGM